MLTSKERIRIALEGGKPDRVPVAAVYGAGYIMRSAGRDIREKSVCTAREWIESIEKSFLRHKQIDLFRLQPGRPASAGSNLKVEKIEAYWRVTDTVSGERWGLLPDGSICEFDGVRISRKAKQVFAEPRIRSEDDMDTVVGKVPDRAEMEGRGTYGPLKYMVSKYPDYHFSSQIMCPFSKAVEYCGGYVEGLLCMKEDATLFHKLLRRCTDIQIALTGFAKKSGADSVWFTSYYTGADTLSPELYKKEVFRYDLEICLAAKKLGLYVLHWYLGDLLPNIETVMKLQMDALVLEQGRKGYRIDPAEIRRIVGDRFCLFGFGNENDYCTGNTVSLESQLKYQIKSAGKNGAFVAGTPVMPDNARPEAVDFYFNTAFRLGDYTRESRKAYNGKESARQNGG